MCLCVSYGRDDRSFAEPVAEEEISVCGSITSSEAVALLESKLYSVSDRDLISSSVTLANAWDVKWIHKKCVSTWGAKKSLTKPEQTERMKGRINIITANKLTKQSLQLWLLFFLLTCAIRFLCCLVVKKTVLNKSSLKSLNMFSVHFKSNWIWVYYIVCCYMCVSHKCGGNTLQLG